MAGNDRDTSKSSYFEIFPSIHEDELSGRNKNRGNYQFSQFVPKKIKRRGSERTCNRSSTVTELCSVSGELENTFLPEPAPISDVLLDVSDDEILVDSTSSTSDRAPVNPEFSYIVELIKHNAVTFVDSNLSLFALPDFDVVSKKFRDSKYVLVSRIPRDNTWLYTCHGGNCVESTRRTDYLQSLSSTVIGNSLIEAGAVYGKCIHVEAMEKLMHEFDMENNLSPDSHDHTYQSGNQDFIPLNGNKFCIFVRGNTCVPDGVVGLQGADMTCFTCVHHINDCQHVTKIVESEEILENEMPDCLVDFYAELNYRRSVSAPAVVARQEWRIRAVSSQKIFFNLTSVQKNIYSNLEGILHAKASDTGLVLEPVLQTSLSCPMCSSQCIGKSQRALCFLKKRIYHCEVLYYICADDECDGKVVFDGADLTLLNMGSYLICYEVLRDFMFHFLKGRCTLFTYYSVWQEIMSDADVLEFRQSMSYHHWRFAWYSFLDLLDINYEEGFCCPICGKGDSLDTVICDATALSFRQELCTSLKSSRLNYSTMRRSTGPRGIGSRHRDRIYLTEKHVRQMVEEVGKDICKVSETSLVSLHIELQRCAPALDSFLSWCIAFFGSDVPFSAPVRALYIALGKSSPVCALLPPLDSLATLYQKLMDNEPIKQFPEYMLLLQQCCPILFDIVRIIDGDQLPDALCTLITDLLVKAKSPFSVDSVTDGEPESSPIHDLEYFPNLPIVRSRGDYCFDEVSSNICTKKSNRHPSLLPGIFLLLCQHGITYGFSVMLYNESPNIPFTVFRTRFPTAPRLIVYDNACNLHSYSLNRDPVFFKNTQFLVGRLHWRDHTGCSEAYNLSRYPQWDALNSQAAEQANSCLKYVKGSLSYMNQKNFMRHCQFFIWFRNLQRRKQLNS